VISSSESCGAVLIEGLASSLPVVATRCGGPEDIVTGDVGMLVPSEDPEALSDAIDRMLTERRRFDPAVLRPYAPPRFSWDHLAERYLDVSDDCVNTSAHMRSVA
jgi:glycosyltransferase involved in cell wall biosynthesis